MPTSVMTTAVGARSSLRRVAAISASLVGTYALTSVLGLFFWLLAARQFSVSSVGVGGAAIAMMTLLGTLGTCGLGTLLIARLPHTAQGSRRVLTRSALAVAGTVATLLAFVVPFVAISVLHVGNLDTIAGGPSNAVLFAVGTGLMAVALVIDQAVLVLGSGALQLERNAVASAVKLGALGALALAGQTGGMTIFVAWTLGTLVSLPLVAWRTRGGRRLEDGARLIDLTQLRGLGGQALSHHALNTTLQSPLQVLPLLVLVAVSTEQNGVFTTALQLTGLVFTLPYAITIGLFASAEGDTAHLIERMRFTIPLALGISVVANLALFPLAPYILSVFGSQYSTQGIEILRILAFAGLPFVVKDHFVALRRVQGRTGQATLVMLGLTVVELAAAYAGVRVGATIGLCLAWVAVLVVEAVVLAFPLVAATRHRPSTAAPTPTPTVMTGTAQPSMEPAATATTATATTANATAAQPEPGLSPWRRLVGLVGVGPVVLLMTAGLVPMAMGVGLGRQAGDANRAQTLYVLGLVVIFLPAALGVLLPRVRTSTRVVLALALAVLLQLTRVVLYPTRFMFHDELIHANVLRLIGDTGRLFTENSLLPITAYYPGLELATNAVQELTGLSAHTSAVVLLLAARLVLVLSILLVVSHITGSTRIGATAVIVYACNPQMLFFNSQFSYQSLALPLAAFTVYLVLSRRRGSRTSLVAAVLAIVAVAFTHHVTTALLVVALVVWWAVEVALRRRLENSARSLAALAGAAVAAFALTLANPGNTLASYLGAIATSSVNAVVMVANGTQTRKVFQNAAGVVTAPWEKYVIIASLVLTLLVLVPSLLRARRFVRDRVTVAVLLCLVALLYPVIPGGHLTVSTAEVGDRAAGFVFLGVAFVVAWWIWQHRVRVWQSAALAVGAAVIFLGSVVLGAGSISQQLPGPFRVSDDARSIDADNLAAAGWMSTHLPAGSRVYADRVGGLLAAADGKQYSITHIGTDIDASRLLLDPTYGPADVELVRRADIRYLISDRRDAFGLPNQGVYIENGEFGGDNRTAPVPGVALRKFSSVPGVDVIYDNGSIVIYDLEALRATP
ncbi:lipopolysaccharide biosynthesis protein [Lapillicoccus sp.]|uniref:lipopolysaccharide biosynthesis protein n=1 Tax=Lapillicoccus sp. TaxID=1909287 RepID=UPI003983B8E0